MRCLAAAPDGFLETKHLIAKLEVLFKPSGAAAEIIAGRADIRFSRKVRNIVSHRENANNPIKRG